jgi:hypothetical protein
VIEMQVDWRRELCKHSDVRNFNTFRKENKEALPCLYKFFRPTYHAIRNLELKQIYLAEPRSFNDPLDSRMAFSKQEMYYTAIQMPLFEGYRNEINSLLGDCFKCSFEDIEKLPEKSEALIGFITTMNHNYSDDTFIGNLTDTRNFFRVSCFSERADSSPMWGYYADDHKGFCVKYDFSKLDDEDILNFIYPVVYSDKPHSSGALIYIKKYIDDYKNGTLDEQYTDIIDLGVWASIIKASEWHHEHEWRLIISDINRSKYFNHTFQVPIPARCIDSIILGVNTENLVKEHLTDIAKKHEAKLHESVFVPNSYKMETSLLHDYK